MNEVSKFSLYIHEDTNEMCVLHREYPSCLVRLERVNPELFNVARIYEDLSVDEVLKHPFIDEMRSFIRSELRKRLNK